MTKREFRKRALAELARVKSRKQAKDRWNTPGTKGCLVMRVLRAEIADYDHLDGVAGFRVKEVALAVDGYVLGYYRKAAIRKAILEATRDED